jgi:hypothetical protein
MKSYSYYAYACFRAYFENRATPGSAEVAEKNHDACDSALSEYDFNTLLILREIYTSESVLSVAVRTVSNKYEIKADDIWKLIAKIEKDFAVARGLI